MGSFTLKLKEKPIKLKYHWGWPEFHIHEDGNGKQCSRLLNDEFSDGQSWNEEGLASTGGGRRVPKGSVKELVSLSSSKENG